MDAHPTSYVNTHWLRCPVSLFHEYVRFAPQVLDLSGVAALAQEHSLCVEGEALKDLIRHWQVGSPSDPS